MTEPEIIVTLLGTVLVVFLLVAIVICICGNSGPGE